uniref:Cell division protein FtsA n=1 Tax=candidate division WOR-3 bacterium TaxID=2052148 RepID=A0A7V4E3A4_UNCW3
MKKERITAIDLGVTKIKCAISEIDLQGKINILGFSESETKGFDKGIITDSEAALESLRSVISEIENETQIKVKKTKIVIGLQGEHIKELPGESNKDDFTKPVQAEDIYEIKRKAQRISLPSEIIVWQLIPLEYSIDGLSGIKQPVGMPVFNKLTLKALLLTIPKSCLATIVELLHQLDLRKFELIFQNATIGLGVCDEEELMRGVAVLDIGGGLNFGIYKNNEYQAGFSLPFGGIAVTTDIALVFLTPYHYAEKIKREYGVAKKEYIINDVPINIINYQGKVTRRINQSQLSQVIECRLRELLLLAKAEYEKRLVEEILPLNIVITGGVANTPGIDKLAEEIFSLPTRIGFSPTIKEKISPPEFTNPQFATLIGLISYKLKKKDYQPVRDIDFFDKIKIWIKRKFNFILEE